MNPFDVIQLKLSQMTDASGIAANPFEADLVFSYLTPNDPQLRFQALTWLIKIRSNVSLNY